MKKLAVSLFFLFSLFSLSFTLWACASSESSLPKSPMPENATFTGLWYSSFGDMKLTQTGDTVRGSFDYRKGGEVEGTVVGGVFRFRWIQPGDFSVGRREVFGKGYLVMQPDGLNLKGEWGYGDDYRGGGVWVANKATELYD